MDIEELSKKIDKYHEESNKRAKNYKYQSLGYILYGFTLAMLSITITNPKCINIVIVVAFFLFGLGLHWYSAKFKVK